MNLQKLWRVISNPLRTFDDYRVKHWGYPSREERARRAEIGRHIEKSATESAQALESERRVDIAEAKLGPLRRWQAEQEKLRRQFRTHSGPVHEKSVEHRYGDKAPPLLKISDHEPQ